LTPDWPLLAEQVISTERVFDGHFLKVQCDTVRLPDGRQTQREYIVHPGAVMLIPLLDSGNVVLERQWRQPLQRVFVEFPAGKIDPDETPLETARRELREETGYTAAQLDFLCSINNAISYSTERIDLFLARGLVPGPRRLDDGEFLDVIDVPAATLLAWVREGSITDVKTIVGAFWLEKITAGLWRLA